MCDLYGFKYSGEAWRAQLDHKITVMGSIPCRSDPDVCMHGKIRHMVLIIR